MKTVERKAYAKVNLALDVLRRREDGYHDVSMIMQNLDLYDVLTFTVEELDEMKNTALSDSDADDEPTSKGQYEITITSNKECVPTDERNLVYKAIALMCETYNLSGKITVDLQKNIPVEAGMAGGSTDCAAAFHAINELYDVNASVEDLMKLGVTLGADVPYCILAKTALSEGIGELLTPVSALKDCYVLVVKPPISVSTKMVYTNLKANELEHHPDVAGMVDALSNNDLDGVCARMENVLETVTVNLYPEIEQIKNLMKKQGAENAIMSGSGPTVFGIYKEESVAKKAAEAVRQAGYSDEVYVVMPVNSSC